MLETQLLKHSLSRHILSVCESGHPLRRVSGQQIIYQQAYSLCGISLPSRTDVWYAKPNLWIGEIGIGELHQGVTHKSDDSLFLNNLDKQESRVSLEESSLPVGFAQQRQVIYLKSLKFTPQCLSAASPFLHHRPIFISDWS
jgi:hypothetical protein